MAATDLDQLAAAVLAEAEDILAAETSPADRVFGSHGPPALDCCDQLAVHVAAIGEAASTAQTQTPLTPGLGHTFGRINLTTLGVTITRCHPVVEENGQPPNPDELTAAAAVLRGDAWALWNGLYRARDVLFEACDLVFFDGLVPLPPQGGCAGWLMQIRFELPGYQRAQGS